MKDFIKMFELHILVGLPASGKTYWVKSNFDISPYNCKNHCYIDLDKHMCGKTDSITGPMIYEALAKSNINDYMRKTWGYCENQVKICVDGLLTNVSNTQKVIETILDYIETNCKDQYGVDIILHKWNENRGACLNNDKFRVLAGERESRSVLTISETEYNDTSFDETFINSFKDNEHVYDTKIENHTVERIDLYDAAFAPCIGYDRATYSTKSEKTHFMYSEEWCGGGTWGNYTGETGTVSADDPLPFDELDELLTNVCPNITYLQFRKIEKNCVELESFDESDYYGGSTTRYRWKCDISKLYNMLNEMNLINDCNDA